MFFTRKKEKALKDKISLLEHELEDVRQIVKTQELIHLRAENAYLKEKEQLINNIKIKLKSVAYSGEDDVIIVKYEIPNIKLNLDADRNVIKNDFFYSINKLQLLSMADMKKIQSVINEVKK